MEKTTSTSPRPNLDSLRIAEEKRKNNSSGKRSVWIALTVFVVILLAVASFSYFDRKAGVEVAVARTPTTGAAGVLNASGYITPRRRATIAAKITGRVTGVFFDEGTRVRQGQLLATSMMPMSVVLLNRPRPIATPLKPRSPTMKFSFATPKSNFTAPKNCGKPEFRPSKPSTRPA